MLVSVERRKRCFLLSKPVSEFTGTIGDALRHYENTLLQARALPTGEDVDSKSPMGKKGFGVGSGNYVL